MSPAGAPATLNERVTTGETRTGGSVREHAAVVQLSGGDHARAVAQEPPAGRGTEPGARFGPTKFRPLTLPATLVSRPVLHGRLAEGAVQRLTVVVGPAGAGKSVLLADWAAARPPGLTSWLSCDRADADPVRFWTGFIAAHRAVEPEFGAELLAIDAVTSGDMARALTSRAAASAPNHGSVTWAASTNPAQNRSGSWSARSQDNQEVTPGGRAAAQSASSTLLPAPADPTTTVSRWPAPAASRRCSAGRDISVAGSPGGRNFASANRAPRTEPCPLIVPSVICPRFPGLGQRPQSILTCGGPAAARAPGDRDAHA